MLLALTKILVILRLDLRVDLVADGVVDRVADGAAVLEPDLRAAAEGGAQATGLCAHGGAVAVAPEGHHVLQ